MESATLAPDLQRKRSLRPWVYDVLLVYILLAGAYFRLVGIDWGENQYLHPDERFMVWVGSDIAPVKSLAEYFDTAQSSLNPHNRGHGFYVYGTLPLFLARYLVEGIYGHSGFNEMTAVGRPLSALADLLTVLLVYLAASRLFDRRVGVLAAAFYAFAVLPIQLSHYFKEDTFTNLFTFLAIYFAVCVATREWETSDRPILFRNRPFLWYSIGFGVALGCAVASKLNAVPVALLLPTAFALGLRNNPHWAERGVWRQRAAHILGYLVLAGLVSLLVFRLFQPYAFSGPGFLGVIPNPKWVENIREQRIQSTGDVDFPPALQWARRPVWFAGQNLVLWGLGLPLGLLAWAGFFWAGRCAFVQLRNRRIEPSRQSPWENDAYGSAPLYNDLGAGWRRHALIWSWTGFYFIWLSLTFNPTMRYLLPIYPTLAIYAAWLVLWLFDHGRSKQINRIIPAVLRPSAFIYGSVSLGVVALLATFAWAFAFTRIYTRPVTRIAASRWVYQNIPGPVNLHIQTEDGVYNQPLPVFEGQVIQAGQPLSIPFTPKAGGRLTEITLPHVVDGTGSLGEKRLAVTIARPGQDSPLASAALAFPNESSVDRVQPGITIPFDSPTDLEQGESYSISLSLEGCVGKISLVGSAPATESTWDDAIPLRVDGYDGYGGIYRGDLNFEMYWDDNPDKLARFLSILDQAEVIFITSNRQWGTTTRVPERYPLTTAYYRHLIGCPAERSVEWCYKVAQVGTFQGNLGFELQQVFVSSPNLGPLRINDQFAEEAFTVYDHPKVFIFRKTEAYDLQRARDILGAVDLVHVMRVTPRQARSYPANLVLPADRWAEQMNGGSWMELYNTRAWQNRSQILAVLFWYLSLMVLGWLVYPWMRLALSGLPDHGFPLARLVGLLALSYLVWLAGSLRIPATRLTIGLMIVLLALSGAALAFRDREAFRREWHSRRSYFLAIESLFLAFFLLDLAIRIGNPDLWHPWKGGEKPMDFAYLNAVLKSTTFPPYDPWYAGGYLNYYYYGFVLLGVLVKFLGIVPAVAYNLILPTVFGLIAMGAFSIAWNLSSHSDRNPGTGPPVAADDAASARPGLHDYLVGLAGALGMAVFGNLGMVRMIFQGYQKLAAPGGVLEGAGLLTRWVWAVRGFIKALDGTPLPYALGDWYWIPSRAIPTQGGEVEPITEFPFFTVLYGDPHAHLFALPVALLVLAFALSLVLGHARWRGRLGAAAAFCLGGLGIGTLRPTNTWDFYPYLALGGLAMGYALWRGYCTGGRVWAEYSGASPPGILGFNIWRALVAVSGAGLLAGLSFALFQPYVQWYGQAYSKVDLWRGTHTSLTAYLTHWGLFLFPILSWMAWETRDWLANTPVSALRKLEPYRSLIWILLALLVVLVIWLLFLGVGIAWFVLPLAAWAGSLMLRPGQTDAKRFVLFLVGTGLMLTLMVEVIVLVGDIARMNTVFKFYLQVWTLLAVCTAAALGWLIRALPAWEVRWRSAWQVGLILLIASAALYPMLASLAKIQDRMSPSAPHTLDGMAYMAYSTYAEEWGVMDLSQDYRAIRWMQENVPGSPVIVEANLRNLYRWGSRFSIYTGLPGLVGWEWHQQQQRALLPSTWVTDRILEIDNFYQTTDLQQARDFLRKYDVRYIILGQQERGHYPGPGLDKFPAANGVLWREVYRDGDTVIYEVL